MISIESGAEEYPTREVRTDDELMTEAFSQLMLITEQHGGTIYNVRRFEPYQGREENTIDDIVDQAGSEANANQTPESKKLILSTRLDRDYSPFTGVDLTINPFGIEFEFEDAFHVNKNGANSAKRERYIHIFVVHDLVVNISSNGVVVRT